MVSWRRLLAPEVSLEASRDAKPTDFGPQLQVAAPEKQRLSADVVARLHDDHARELLLFLTGVLRDAHLAADVVQITFSRLLEQGGQTAQESRKAWIFRVAYNEALDWRRKQARRERLQPEVMATRSFVTAEPILEILQEETVDQVRNAIARLPNAQQQVLRRRIYEEQTFAEISRALNIPLGTALGRMRQALQQLRKIMNPSDPS